MGLQIEKQRGDATPEGCEEAVFPVDDADVLLSTLFRIFL